MAQGLSSAQALQRLAKYGENRFERQKPFSVFKLILAQFTSPFISILLAASFISLLLGDVIDAGVIFLAVAINTILGFVQEYKAQHALEALAKVLSPAATVIRDGKAQSLPVSQVVPGDVVILENGEQIAADGYFIECSDLVVNEAVLTGESRPVKKVLHPAQTVQAVAAPQEKEAKFFGYMGTTVVGGKATMVVVSTGHSTQVGQIAKSLHGTPQTVTPLQRKLTRLSHQLAIVVGVVVSIIFVVGVANHQPAAEMLKLSVAMFVSAIPEGLAITLTIILAIGMQRILRRKALVRKLVAAETLGSVTVICADKTGTITTGKLKVLRVSSSKKATMRRAAKLLTSPTDDLEIAVRQWLGKVKSEPEIFDDMPFSSERKFSVKLTDKDMFMTGAPDVVLNHCSGKKKDIEEEILVQARAGYRIVGIARRDRKNNEKDIRLDSLGKFEWVGYFVLADEVRTAVKSTLQKIRNAQIDVKVITGDYAETARAVLDQVGMKVKRSEVMLGHEFRNMPLTQFKQRVQQTKLFARTTPDQKLTIIQALQSLGEVVAMTGDGVNDAPALKQADIGVVVSTASDVSKETADMVLLDDKFTTIVAAVEEGRSIFENLRKVMLYLLANSFAETTFVLGAILLGVPLPVTAVQILWVNVMTDGLPDISLTLEPKETGLLNQPPRPKNTPLLDKEIKLLIGLISVTTGLVILVVFLQLLPQYDLSHLRTLCFTMLAVMSLLYVFSSRSLRRPVWRSDLRKNLWLLGAVGIGFLLQLSVIYWSPLQSIFETTALNLIDWAIVFGASLGLIVIIEIVKLVWPRGEKHTDRR